MAFAARPDPVTADESLNLGTARFARAVWPSADPEGAFRADGIGGPGLRESVGDSPILPPATGLADPR